MRFNLECDHENSNKNKSFCLWRAIFLSKLFLFMFNLIYLSQKKFLNINDNIIVWKQWWCENYLSNSTVMTPGCSRKHWNKVYCGILVSEVDSFVYAHLSWKKFWFSSWWIAHAWVYYTIVIFSVFKNFMATQVGNYHRISTERPS